MANVRIAFYNVENLFARAALLNVGADNFDPRLLDRLSSLRKELARDSYAGREDTILRLYQGLAPFIRISEERENLLRFDREGRAVSLTAAGRDDWDGSIRLRESPLSQHNRASTAHVILSVAPDVLALAEVENRRILERFNNDLLRNRYPYAMLIDGNDERGIDVGVLSRFPINSVSTHIFDTFSAGGALAGRRIFQRDCLEVGIQLPNGAPLMMLVSHFKSRRSGRPGEPNPDELRRAEAQRVAEIMQRYDLSQQLVTFVGDLNDTKDRPPYALQPLWQVERAKEVFEQQFPQRSHEDLWTVYFAPEQLRQKMDFMFASDALLQHLKQAGIERRGMFDLAARSGGQESSFDMITREEEAASDHALIWADYEIA